MTLNWPTVPLVVKLRLLGDVGQLVMIEPAALIREAARRGATKGAMTPEVRRGIVARVIEEQALVAVRALALEMAKQIVVDM